LPNLHVLAVLAVTIVTFYLYTRRWIRMELVSLLLLAALLSIFYLFPYVAPGQRITEAEVLQAFGHPALVAICSLMILARGLTMTGALEPMVRLLGLVWDWNTAAGLLLTLLLAAAASGVINDTPVLVMMLPLLLSLAERTGYPASRTLMPVSFAILAGGTLTSIGTSTNLLVLSIAADFGMRPMGIFDFTATAGVAVVVALAYLWLVAPRLLGARLGGPKDHQREFDARIVVNSPRHRIVGKDRAGLRRMLGRHFPLAELIRGDMHLQPDAFGVVETGDVLILRDTPNGLREIVAALNTELTEPAAVSPLAPGDDQRDDVSLGEAVIGTRSSLIGSTLTQARFAERFGVTVVGLHRGTEQILRDGRPVCDVPLAAGDVLLVQGRNNRLRALKAEPNLMVLDGSVQLPRSPLAWRALAIMALVILASATHVLPIHVAAFFGVIAMLVAGCVRLDGVGRALSPAVILLVASSIALGQSIVATGAADWIAQGVTALVSGASPAVQVATFMAFSALLTNFVSNSAAAAVGTPIAVATATQLGAPLEPFVLAILFGANLSFATPMAYQTNLLVMNAAGYTFRDFVRVGLPLVLIMLATLSWLLVRRYGF
jgi:di/tricarboxylate transporter